MQWHKESAEQTHQKAQVNAILEVSVQIVHFEVQLIQMLVDECNQRLEEKQIIIDKNFFYIFLDGLHSVEKS